MTAFSRFLLFVSLLSIGGLSLLGACSDGGDQEATAGKTSAGDGATLSDAAALGDGAASDDGVAQVLKDGAGVVKDVGGTVKDAGGVVKDAGGMVKDAGGTVKDAGGTVKDSGGVVKDAGGTAKDSGGVDVPDDPNVKYKLCSELFTCAQIACDLDPSPGCESICTKVSGNAAKAAFEPFATCMWKDCYPAKCAKAADKKACTQACYGQCGGLIYKCMADGESAAKACGEGFECLDACGKKGGDEEFSCSIGCYKSLSPAAQGEFDAAFACVAKSKTGHPWAGCTGQLLKCAAGGTVGSKSCIDVASCMDDCPKDFQSFSCNGKCYGGGTQKAQADYEKVFECMLQSQQPGALPMSCIEDFLPCADPQGNLVCLKIWPCAEACKAKGGKDGDCTFQCLHQSSLKEAKAFLQLVACMDGVCKPKCKNESDPIKRKACEDACNKKECGVQLKACLG